MKIPWIALALLMAASWIVGAPAATPDAFLDAPFPKKWLALWPVIPESHPTHLERIERLKEVIPRPIIYPAGLEKFVQEKDAESDWSRGKVLFLGEGDWVAPPQKVTLRNYLDNILSDLNLTWRYDASRDAIVTDFGWHREDSRTSRELLAFMMQNPYPRHRIPTKDDPWGDAFNALLSKPENFATIWSVRFTADQRTMLDSPLWVRSDNMLTGKIKDDSGTEHFLVLNDQEEVCNPGPPGSFSYYLFDLNGKFEQGGIWTAGYRCFDDCAWIEPDGHHFTFRTMNNGMGNRDSTFAFEKGRLVRKNFLFNGRAPTNWELMGLDRGSSLYATSDSK